MMRSTATVTPNTKSPLSVPSSIADEHGLEVLLPIASNTEGLRQSLSIDHFIKKMSDGGNEISESALAQGFSWQPKAPILPGQFYKRPQQLVENAPEISKHNRSPGTSNAASRSRNTSAKSHYTQSPLKLSEFFFDENRECSDNLPKTVLDSAKVTPPRDAGPNCSLTADDNTESPQEVSISFSSKGVDHSASYQWPRNISGDIQSTDGGSPRGAIVNDKGNIQDMRVNRTIRHTVASRDQNSSAHVDKMSPHTRGIRNARRHASPTSVCGDLEGLVHQEERRGVRQLYENVGSSSHQSRHIRLFDGSQRAHRRSHSRVSNISRKRSATHKHRRLHDSDRKLTMMLKVAEQWNECIQTAEEEKEEAMNEMDRLQAVLLRQYKLLEETQASLRDERAEVQKMKDQCSEFQEREVGAHKEKLKLSNEIESLRNDLEDSQKRVGKWGEKFKTKINEVISEQNDLHQRSHGYYEIVLKELQETEKKRSSETDAIKKAIALSQEKRKEMALVLEESQLQSQRDLEFKDKIIAELEKKLEKYDSNCFQDVSSLALMHSQHEAALQRAQKTLDELEAKVDTIHAGVQQSQEEVFEKQMSHMRECLDTIVGQIQPFAHDSCVKSHQLDSALYDFESSIVSKILSSVKALERRQESAEAVVARIGQVFESQLCSISSTLLQHMQRTIHENGRQNLETKIDQIAQSISEELLLARSSYQELGGSMKSWAAEAREAIHSTSHSQTIGLSKFLEQLENKSNEQFLQFQHLCNDHANKMGALQAKILSERSPSEEAIQLAFDGLEKKVAASIFHHNKDIEDLLRQNGLAITELSDSLKGVIQLSSDNTTIGGLDAGQLRCKLEQEQRTVTRLNQRIRGFEQETKATDAMRKRWRDNIRTIDVLRTQLAVAYQRMPRVERIAAKLEKIFSFNDTITATTKFLSGEASWIQGELEARDSRPNIITPISCTSQPDTGKVDENLITPYQPQLPQVLGDFQFLECTNNLINRKVTVRSPAWDIHSPSPPLSIEQEQIRRREGAKPRSILRPTITLDKNQIVIAENTSSGTMNHSQFKRPVAAWTNEPSKPFASESMMEGIRAGFLNLTSDRSSDWAFTTVAEFENSARMNHVSTSCVTEKWSGLDLETNSARKRIKIDSSQDEYCNKVTNPNEDKRIAESMSDNKPGGYVGVKTTTGHHTRPVSRPTHHSTL